MAPTKRSRDDDDGESEESEVIDFQTARSELRQLSGKRSRLSMAAENGGSVLSDEEEEDYTYSYEAGEQEIPMEADFESEDENADEDDEQATQHLHKQFKKLEENKENMPQEHGIIEEVFCRNFMCHAKLRVKLGPLINFIIGHNGSGKSAVMTALTLCLGAKATATNRGASLKNFIKEGEESATLSVKIKNQGEMAYQPEIFGDSIIIERHFTKSGSSSFKIKSALDRTISTKRGDLEDVLDYLALQLDNPMNVLSQDMARQFLSSSSPHDKYKFFIRGTQLEQLDRDYTVMEEYLDSTESKLHSREDDINALGAKAREAEAKKKLIDKSASLRDKIYHMQCMFAWAQVEEEEQRLRELEVDVQEADEKIQRVTKEAEEAAAAYDNHDSGLEQAQAAKTELEREKDLAMTKQAGIKEPFDKHKTDLIENGTTRRNIQQDLKIAREEVTKHKAAIEVEQARIENANGPAQSRKLAELEEARANAEDCRRRADQGGDKNQLERDRDAIDRKLKDSQSILGERKEAVRAAETRMHGLQRDQGDYSAAFHNKLANLERAIRNETRFRVPPVGPMGKHVQLLKPEWSSIIESVCGGNLEAWVVTNKQDQSILSELQRRTQCESMILIGDPRHIDTASNEPDPEQDTIMRVLQIDNDLVRNQLIINQSIDQTVLIQRQEDAMDFMYGGSRPKNTKVTICMNKHHRGVGIRYSFTRQGAELSGPVRSWDKRPRMRTSIEAQLRQQQENINYAKREMDDAERSNREIQNQLKTAQQTVFRFDRQQRELRVARQEAEDKVESLEQELESLAVDAGTLEALNDQLREAQEAESQHANSYQDAIEAKDQLNELQQQLKPQLNAATKEVEEVEAKIAKAEKKIQRLGETRQNALREKNRALNMVTAAASDREEVEMRRRRREDTLRDEIIPQASEIGARINVDQGMTPKTIDERLESLLKERQRFESRAGGTREEIVERWAKARSEYKQAKNDLDSLRSLAQQLKQTIRNRKNRWKMFRRYITSRAQITFVYLLSERAFRGRIRVDHKDRAMDISVEPDISRESNKGRQTKTLSGGEKSFSTICLLLSIWEAMGSPIRCLDEFDVFMDNVNRDISMKMMIQASRRAVGRQFIFITPQAMNNAQLAADVKIHKMSDPERGQTALSFGN